MKTYGLRELADLSGVKKTNIQNWVRRGYLQPDKIEGGKRRYSERTANNLIMAFNRIKHGMRPSFAFKGNGDDLPVVWMNSRFFYDNYLAQAKPTPCGVNICGVLVGLNDGLPNGVIFKSRGLQTEKTT